MQIFIQKLKKISLLLALAGTPVPLLAQEEGAVEVKEQEKGVTVTGTIVDAVTGIPLPGVNVSVPGFSADLTDLGGNFTLQVPSYSSTIRIGGAGSEYQYTEVALKGRTAVEIALMEEPFTSFYDLVRLPNDVVKPKSHVVASVQSIELGEEKWRVPAGSAENYLQGRVPGLSVVRRSGMPGAGADLYLRGFSSLNTTNKPLIIVDGMIYDMGEDEESLISGQVNNPFSSIDIKDIEDISVIRDATSVYGSKGANGAIIITTSRAEELATRIDFATYGGINLRPENLPVLEADRYRVYLAEVLQGSGLTDREIQSLTFMQDDPNTPNYYNYHNNTNWQDEVFENSYNQNYYLQVRGGDNIARYALSMGYLNQGGIVKNTGYERYNTRFNANLNMSPRLKVDASMAFSYGQQSLAQQGIAPKTNPIYLSLIKAPLFAPRIFSDAGVLSPNLSDEDTLNVGNPTIVVNKLQARSQNYRFFGSVKAAFQLTEDMAISSQFGITNNKVQENFFTPSKGVLSDTLISAIAESSLGSQVLRTFSVYNDTRLSYVNQIGINHHINTNLGVRYLDQRNESDFALDYNSPADEITNVGSGGTPALRTVGGEIGQYRWLNYYLGANYNFLNKYFVSFNVAADASSRFGEEVEDGIGLFGTRFGIFPSLGAAWLLSSEEFMANTDFVELLKLRATYSITGNDDIGNYTSRQYYVGSNLQGLQGLVRGNIGNPALQWETSRRINAGVDVSFFRERFNLSLDVYKIYTDNMLIKENLPTPAGIDYLFSNTGAMENQGVELYLNSRVINTANVQWDLGLNLATFQNKITALPSDDIITNFGGASILTRVGEAANLFYGYETEGVFANDADNLESPVPLTTRTPDGSIQPFRGGDVRFVDQLTIDSDGDGVMDTADGIIDENDRVAIGNPNPDFTGFINSKVTYKRISLDADFTFSKGNDIFNYNRSRLESLSGPENQTMAVLNRWRKQGQVTDIPRASWGDPMGNARFSDRWIEDGSYLRLRSLTLSYELPIRTNNYLKYATFYTTGTNLLTFTKYLGYDPEFSASPSIFAQGVDTGLVPQFRSVLIGVRLGL